MNLDDRTTVLANQDSFDNWVVANDGNKSKVAVDILRDILNDENQDNDIKISEASKVVAFYWGMA
jgi:hypothetical protein